MGRNMSEADREAIEFFELAKRWLAENEIDRLQPEKRIVIKRRAGVIIITFRPYGYTESVLVAIDNGEDAPTIVSFHRGAWRKVLRKFGEAMSDAP